MEIYLYPGLYLISVHVNVYTFANKEALIYVCMYYGVVAVYSWLK